KLRSTVATITKQIQLPNHDAATFPVLASPELQRSYTPAPPINPTPAPTAHIRRMPTSNYSRTIRLASSVSAATPSPTARTPLSTRTTLAAAHRFAFLLLKAVTPHVFIPTSAFYDQLRTSFYLHIHTHAIL